MYLRILKYGFILGIYVLDFRAGTSWITCRPRPKEAALNFCAPGTLRSAAAARAQLSAASEKGKDVFHCEENGHRKNP